MNGFLSDLCIWQSTRLLIRSRQWSEWARMLNHSDRLTAVRRLYEAHWRERAVAGLQPGRRD